ncbi:hypothetical protein DFH08DRAFT_799633 [Mycena albidolilacea]|uniref:Uncharacterized protein n=1 Tax=Mycena albidolilacea TaxID=1033008 RepID=A0AAD7F379_9AGAR|nr:hypothetical protein DFH08DRAFT_799633 [Mycena albidolilacea]
MWSWHQAAIKTYGSVYQRAPNTGIFNTTHTSDAVHITTTPNSLFKFLSQIQVIQKMPVFGALWYTCLRDVPWRRVEPLPGFTHMCQLRATHPALRKALNQTSTLSEDNLDVDADIAEKAFTESDLYDDCGTLLDIVTDLLR